MTESSASSTAGSGRPDRIMAGAAGAAPEALPHEADRTGKRDATASQQRADPFGAERLAVQIALREIAAEGGEPTSLIARLDALAGRGEVARSRDRQQRLGERDVLGWTAPQADERAVELERADRKPSDVLERRPLAEVLDREIDAQVAERERRVEMVRAAWSE